MINNTLHSNKKAILLVGMMLLFAVSVSAITVDQLINSYDYGFSDGTMRIVGVADGMTEKCGATINKDYVHWDAGDIIGFDRIMDFKIYNLG